jgi:hypothetical protein
MNTFAIRKCMRRGILSKVADRNFGSRRGGP